MSYPILYNSNETEFNHNGIGTLSDCISCVVTEERNGAYELEMEYPTSGIHADMISSRSIIKAKPNVKSKNQLFRVYGISKPLNGVFKISAEHISYDLTGVAVSPFFAASAKTAFKNLKKSETIPSNFSFSTDIFKSKMFTVENPSSVRYILGGSEGSFLDAFGGEFEFDNFNVILHEERGRESGVLVKYGKNLTNFEQEENCSNVFTAVYPFYRYEETLIELPEKIVRVPGNFNFEKIKVLDLTMEFESLPTVEELEAKTQSYINSHQIGVPDVSITLSFVDLSQTEEYKDFEKEAIGLCDTVGVEFPLMGVTAKSKVIRTVFDSLEEKFEEIELGSYRYSIADTIKDQQKEIEKVSNPTFYKEIVNSATDWLTNGKGYKVERRDANGNAIDTLYMDTPDIETAKNVLRIGQSGIGFSKDGVNGPYYSAWTIDGRFNADFIVSGSLVSQNGTFNINLNENLIEILGEREYGDKVYQTKNVFSNNGINGFGEDEEGNMVQTLSFSNGVSDAPTMIYNPYGNGIEVFSMNGVNRFGATTSPAEIVGSYVDIKSVMRTKIENKSVSWEQREDGKYILVGE